MTAAAYYPSNKADNVSNSLVGVLGADYILSRRTDVYATVAYAASTHYANDQYTPVGLTNDTAYGPHRTGVTLGIRHRF